MYNCSKHAHFLQFHGDHSTCTQPARIQEALAPQVHCDEKPDTESAKLCISVTKIDRWGESSCVYIPDTKENQ